MIRALACLLLCALCLAAPVRAQDGDAQWAIVSTRVEGLLARDDLSVEGLNALRAELVEWRARFQTAQSPPMARVDALRAQIAALGTPPEEGATEAPDIAAQRAELTTRLDALRAPVVAAEAAFAEADGLVAETDRRIEAARAQDLLRQVPSPLNPVDWGPALSAVAGWFTSLARGLWSPVASAEARAVWMPRGVEMGLLAAAAILLLWRSQTWLARLRDRVALREAENPFARMGLLAISLGWVVLPVAGLYAAMRVVRLMGASGAPVELASTLLPQLGFVVLAGRWLSYQMFPRRPTATPILPVDVSHRKEARLHVVALGVLLAGAIGLDAVAATSAQVRATLPVGQFVLLALAGANLVRLGLIFLADNRGTPEEVEVEGIWPQVLRLLGQGTVAVGVAAPVAAALGYVNLGMAALWPTVLTLAMIAAIGTLQAFFFDVHAAATRRADSGRDALAPTLVGFAVAVCAVPVFALIWGVRPTTLGEWWGTFLRGFALGETRISPGNFLTFALVFGLGFAIVRLLKGVLRTSVLPKTQLDSGGTNAILSGTGYIGLTVALLVAVAAAGINLGGLAIVAGALSVGIGFGLQTIVQNFVSGIILLIERPIKLGDWINVNGTEGFVREISVRSTRVETFDRQDVIVPNADLISGVVTNYTLANSSGRVVLHVGVAYGTDTRRVERILQEVAESHPMVILNPPPLVTFDGFGHSSLDFTVRVVLRDILFKVVVGSEINHAIAERFTAEGLEIPFPQRDIWLRNPETLRAGPAAEETP